MKRSVVVVAALCALAAAAVAGAATQSSGPRVVVKGLNNPRGVTVGPDGAVYVAEAGAAGVHCMGKGQNASCAGLTGRITKVVHGDPQWFSTGFISGGGRDGSFSVGIDDVAVTSGGAVYTIATHVPGAAKLGKAFVAQSGKVLRVGPGSAKTPLGDVSKVEFSQNPAADNVDSDPYSLAVGPQGLVVADAAANDLILVDWAGRTSVLWTFRPQKRNGRTVQSVPTSVTRGPDGAYYVGELGGDGVRGMARIWRVVPGQKGTVWKRGFTAITGLDFGPDGSLYVGELVKHGLAAAQKGDLTGALIRIAPDGRRTELAPGKLRAVGGVGVGRDGTVYVSQGSILVGRGEVVAVKG